MFRSTLFIAFIASAMCVAAPIAQIVDGKIVVNGVTSTKDLRVVVAEGSEADIAARPAMAGEWLVAKDRITFAPKYPLTPGTKYRVIGIERGLTVQAPSAKPDKKTVVTRILPTASEIPSNILRFYIEFNRPMPRGDVYEYVNVFTDKGKKIEWPFLRLDDELWNKDQTRLTLVIDPGRIKKEVKPRIDLGPVFMKDHKYTLVVSGKWPTLDGGTLGHDTRKPITVKPPANTGVDPKKWKLSPPSDSTAALQVAFDRVMDHHLLMRSLAVIDSDGRAIAGTAESTNDDRGWIFKPTAPWKPGKYTLRVNNVLEDVCANRVGAPFEIDLTRPAPKEAKGKQVDIGFHVRDK